MSPYELLSRRESISDRPRPESPLLTRHEPDKMGQQAQKRRRRRRRGFAESRKTGKWTGLRPRAFFSRLNIPRSGNVRKTVSSRFPIENLRIFYTRLESRYDKSFPEMYRQNSSRRNERGRMKGTWRGTTFRGESRLLSNGRRT